MLALQRLARSVQKKHKAHSAIEKILYIPFYRKGKCGLESTEFAYSHTSGQAEIRPKLLNFKSSLDSIGNICLK